jgi:hypothetical protein
MGRSTYADLRAHTSSHEKLLIDFVKVENLRNDKLTTGVCICSMSISKIEKRSRLLARINIFTYSKMKMVAYSSARI